VEKGIVVYEKNGPFRGYSDALACQSFLINVNQLAAVQRLKENVGTLGHNNARKSGSCGV